MLHRVLTIALNAYRESVRARVLIGLAGVAFAAALYSVVVGAFTLNEAPRVVSDLGAMTISVFSLVVAVLIGATSLHRELEQKTILPILARPIRRSEYLVGKYLGTMLVVGVFIMADTGLVLMLNAVLGGRSVLLVTAVGLGLCGLFGIAAWQSPKARTFGPIPWAAAMLVAGIWLADVAPSERRLLCSSATLSLCEVSIVAAIATFFSSFSTPFLSSLLTVGMLVVGRSADSLTRLPPKFFGPKIHQAGIFLSKIVPNLHVYVPSRPLLTGEALEANLPLYLGRASLAALAWVVLLLTAATLIFRRRDFL